MITFHPVLKSLEIPLIHPDTEIKGATRGLAEAKSLLLAITESFILASICQKQTDQSNLLYKGSHAHGFSYLTPHNFIKRSNYIFTPSLSVDLRAL